MRDLISEISASIRSNKLRIALTGFSIGWGLFILIVLLGSGNGIMHGITASFGADTICVMHVKAGKTQLPYSGFGKNRPITVTGEDAQLLCGELGSSITKAYTCYTSPSASVSRGNAHINTVATGSQTGFLDINSKKIVAGNDITQLNIRQADKVCVIGRQTQDLLFRDSVSPVGQTIFLDSIPFKVVGVYNSATGDKSGHTVYAPYTTIRNLYARNDSLSELVLVANNISSEDDYNALQDKVCGFLGKRLGFSPNDRSAIVCSNDFLDYLQLKNVLTILQVFIWVIGLATLVAGVVGISNIMLISVKERTRELGVRKAMGATDAHIITLVLLESVVVSLIFGYVGMILGIGLTQLLAWIIVMTGGAGFFDNPTVGFTTVLAANLIMVIAGLVAGYVPARNAVRIKLVDALCA